MILYSNLFFLSFLLFKVFSPPVLLSWHGVKWSGMLQVQPCSWKCVSLMLHNGDRIAGTLRAKARSAHQGWYKWGNCEKVKEASVHVVSILMCLKIQEGPSTELTSQLCCCGETLNRGIQFDFVSSCFSNVDSVILGRASPGSAGSAHWTKSSSGGQPGTLPS